MSEETLLLYKQRIKLLGKLFIVAFIGVIIALTQMLLKNDIMNINLPIAGLLIIPFAFYFIFLPVVHWKERYSGTCSNFWAILFILSAGSVNGTGIGIGVIVIPLYYIFNIIPDIRGIGTYSRVKNQTDGQSI